MDLLDFIKRLILKKFLLAFSLLLSCKSYTSFSQRTIYFTNSNRSFYSAVKEYQANHWPESQQLFQSFLNQQTHEKDILKEEALFFLFLINVKLKQPNAENILNTYLTQCPYDQLVLLGNHELANYYFQQGQFERAIPFFEKANNSMLSKKEINKQQADLNYSYLTTNELEKYTQIDIKEAVTAQDSFRNGLIAFYKKDYSSASALLKPLKNNSNFKKKIPYILSEINYLTGKKELALKESTTNLINKKNTVIEYNQLAGQLFFEKEDYLKSSSYLSNYISQSNHTRRDDYYRLGYAYFQQGNFESAISNFEQMYKKNDELTQASYYYMAICYLALDQKEKAYTALLDSKKLDFNKEINEAAEFNLAKLSYDQGDDAWAEKQLNFFQKKYPQSIFKDEAIELESYIHIKTDRFDDAIMTMDRMKTISAPLQKVYQRANYAKGVQMLKSQNADKALSYFTNSTKYPIDKDLIILTSFWQAECQYRLGQYQQALIFSDYYLNLKRNASYTSYDKNIHLLRSYLFMHLNQQEKLIKEYKLINPSSKGDPSVSLGTLKPNFVPDKIPIIDNDPYIITFDLPLIPSQYQYTPIPQANNLNNNNSSNNTSYIKLGLGNLGGFEFETGIDASGISKSPLYFNFKRNSVKGKITGQEFGETHLGVYTTQQIKNFSLLLTGEYDQNKQFYYGYDHLQYKYEKSSIQQSFKNLSLGATLIPSQDILKGIELKPSIQVGFYSDAYDAKENNFKIVLPAHKKLNPETDVNLTLESDLNIYSVINKTTQNNSTFSIQPSVSKLWQGATFKIGLYPTIAQQNHLLPDVSVSLPITSLQSNFNLHYVSYLNLNTFKQLTQLNPFIFNYYNVKQSKNTELTAGLKGSLNDNCFYNFRIGFAQYKNLPLFLNDTASDFKQFNVLFADKAIAWMTDFQIDYKLNQHLYAGAIFELRPLLSISTVEKAWHYVPATIDFYSKVKLTNTISTKADFFIRSGYAHLAKTSIVNSIYSTTSNIGFDLNLTTDFKFNNKWTGYINILNVLGTKYQRWYNYPNLGTQFRVGLVRSFATSKN